MLLALEKGQNEFIDSVKPAALSSWLEKHNTKGRSPKNGNKFIEKVLKIDS